MGSAAGLDRETQQVIDGMVDGFRNTVTQLVTRERAVADRRAREAILNELGSALDVPKARRVPAKKHRRKPKKLNSNAAATVVNGAKRMGKTQKKIVDVLAKAKKPLKTAEVATRAKVDANQTSMTLTALVKKGVVKRIGKSKPFTWDLK